MAAKKKSSRSSGRKKSSSRKKSSGRKYGKTASSEVRTEMRHYKSGKHGSRVKSRKQAIAIGLSKARRKGAKVPRKKAA
jgi:hypothetical protein